MSSDSPLTISAVPLPRARAWRKFWRSRSSWIGLALVGAFAFAALSADWLAPYAPNHRDTLNAPPSWRHWLGTDANQYDVLTRVWYGARLSLAAGLISITLAVTLGATAGAVAGYNGGWVDAVLMRTIDIMLAFPSILLAMLVVAAYRPGWEAVIVAVGLINVPIFARQVRASVLTLRELEYVLAARALGASPGYILLRVVFPALVSPIVVLATLGLGSAILEVAGLSFLGIAGDPTMPEWGTMLSQAKTNLHTTVWPAMAPGVAISLTILGFNLLGDGLRDALDPHIKG